MIEVPLTKGFVAVLDDEDAPLAKLRWYADVVKRTGKVYAARKDRRRKTIRLHQAVLGMPGVDIDHVDGDGLNCRRYNLRLATASQNHCNAGKRTNNTSGFKGVVLRKDCPARPWVAQIGINGRRKNLGHFTTSEAAAKAYDVAAKYLHGDFASLNFPTTEAT